MNEIKNFLKKEECDYIISNPPYSLKNEVFERLFVLGKPFAMLVGVVGVFESQTRVHKKPVVHTGKKTILSEQKRVSKKTSASRHFNSFHVKKL